MYTLQLAYLEIFMSEGTCIINHCTTMYKTYIIDNIGVGTMGAPGAGAPLCFLIVT